MSHYTVLVVTEDGDYEKALEPFDENLEVEPYVEETKEQIIERLKQRKKRYDEEIAKGGIYDWFEKYYGQVNWDDNESIYSAYRKIEEDEDFDESGNKLSTYNPNSKWDWYQLGGRWGGSFKLKESREVIKESDKTWATGWEDVKEGYTDHAQFKDIDLTLNPKDVEEAKRFWEVVVENKPAQENEKFDTFWKPEYYIEQYDDKETYIKCQTELFACALLYKGEWIEAGRMGWFGCKNSTSDSEKAYREKFYEVINSLKPTDYLSMIDCHI